MDTFEEMEKALLAVKCIPKQLKLPAKYKNITFQSLAIEASWASYQHFLLACDKENNHSISRYEVETAWLTLLMVTHPAWLHSSLMVKGSVLKNASRQILPSATWNSDEWWKSRATSQNDTQQTRGFTSKELIAYMSRQHAVLHPRQRKPKENGYWTEKQFAEEDRRGFREGNSIKKIQAEKNRKMEKRERKVKRASLKKNVKRLDNELDLAFRGLQVDA